MSDTHAQTVAYVRKTMLPEAEPPLTEKGAVKWLRENLFSSVTNGLLTVISLYVIWAALSSLLPWMFNGVWSANSLSECREVLAARGLTSHDGACWAVINERWHQFLFGFYPSDLYWRPILAFVLFFVAVAPILFTDSVPRQMLWFSGAFPFIAVWLIWGGSFWVPLFAAFGFVVGYFGYRLTRSMIPAGGALVIGLIAALVWWLALSPAISNGLHVAVASPKLAAATETLPTEVRELRALQAELQAERDALGPDIAAADLAAEEIQQRIVAARADGSPTDALMEEYSTARQELAALRDAKRALNTRLALVANDLTIANRLNTRVASIQQLEENLPGWQEEAQSLRAALPASVAALQIAENLPSEISGEDEALLRAALAAENRVTNTEIAIRETYLSLGRVGLRPVSSSDIGGFLLAILMGTSGIVLSLPLGILLALGRQSDMFIINKSCVIFIEVIRGVPLIVWLFTASLLLNYFLPPGTSFDIMLRVIIMVTLFSSAYIAEVIRGGLAALPRGQYEGADSLGLNYWQSMQLIILPQALKISIPGIVNTFIGLFKDTTLVVFVGLFDPLKQMADSIRADANWSGIYWEVFIFPGVIFFILCFSMGRYSMYLEKKLQREHR